MFRYDVAAVKNAAITENVAELLATKLRRLPESTQRTLRVAAVIGSRFDLRLLANVERQGAAATNESLQPAMEAGLIAPLSGLESVDADEFQSPLVYLRFAFRTIECSRPRTLRCRRATGRGCISRSAARGSR